MPEHTPAPTPSRAVYGFAMFLSFRIFFVLYMLWAVIPEEWFKVIGITCLPQRYWAVTIPVFVITVILMFGFLIYPNMGLLMTPKADDMRVIRDSSCVKKKRKNKIDANSEVGQCCCVDKSKCSKDDYERNCGDFVAKAIPVLQDLLIWDVSDHLYLK